MTSTPLLRSLFRRALAEARSPGLWAVLGGWLVAVVVVALVSPWMQSLWFGWLEAPETRWGDGAAAAALRMGIVLVGWVGIDTYGAVIRGRDRKVLEILPVDPAEAVLVECIPVALRGLALVAALLAWSWPLMVASPAGGAGLALGLGSLLVSSMVVGVLVHLGAVSAAEDERWAPILDLIRGSNPRPQAAFLYAPGVVLGGMALGLLAFSLGLSGVITGGVLWFGALAAPGVVALPLAGWIPRLARARWFQASAVLADIEGRYAAVERADEARHVYLDWIVRYFPARLRPWALKDLRHGWRSRRMFPQGAWVLGLAGAVTGWSADGAGSVGVVAGGSAWLLASVVVLLETDEPLFLRVWLAPGDGSRAWARLAVALAWLQPLVWLPAVAAGLRHGAIVGAQTAAVAAISAGIAAVLALWSGSRGRPWVFYGPAAALGAALTVVVWVGRGL